jgi:hypothetical protein
MTVLNLQSDGIFNVLIVVMRTLVQFGPKTKDSLLKLCGAETGKIEPGRLSNVLNRWEQLGLFSSEGGAIQIREPYNSQFGATPDLAEARLPSIARRVALLPENNDRFWEQEESRAADLTRGLSWLLAQDIYEIDTGRHDSISRLENEQLIDESQCILRNDTRWNGLQAWMIYLGFARGGAQLSPDPTAAVKDALSDVFDDEETMTATEFVERLAAVLPVLDGGAYRVKLEEALDPASWRRPADGHLSTSLSRSLKRLAAEGVIAMEARHDFEEGWMLTGFRGAEWGRVTHVRRLLNEGEAH